MKYVRFGETTPLFTVYKQNNNIKMGTFAPLDDGDREREKYVSS